MLCMLGLYFFDIVEVESIRRDIKYPYARSDRIGNHQYTQAVGKWSENISFDAVLYHNVGFAVPFFKSGAEEKKPMWFIMLSGEAVEVTIEEMSINRSYFNSAGLPVKMEISFKLEVYYGEPTRLSKLIESAKSTVKAELNTIVADVTEQLGGLL